MNTISLVEAIVKGVMPPDPVHGYPHIERVRKIAKDIASRYREVDMEVLELAVLMHDIGRFGSLGNTDHALASAQVADALLTLAGYPQDKKERVIHAILTHSYSGRREPKTLEAKILSDADKLDALGAVGILRVLMYSASLGRGIEDTLTHFKEKIINLPKLMKTPYGKEEAAKRVKIVLEFLQTIEKELEI